MNPIYAVLLLSSLLLSGCTSEQRKSGSALSPDDVVASGEAVGTIHWGGQIVRVENQSDRTLVEVLAFPLDRRGRPRLDESPEGRFVVRKAGFLEPHEYAPDKLLEVQGTLDGFSDGKVGEASYRYPVVVSEQLKLWPDAASYDYSMPRINIGVGVGNHGGGVGVGVGF